MFVSFYDTFRFTSVLFPSSLLPSLPCFALNSFFFLSNFFCFFFVLFPLFFLYYLFLPSIILYFLFACFFLPPIFFLSPVFPLLSVLFVFYVPFFFLPPVLYSSFISSSFLSSFHALFLISTFLPFSFL
jgi:hypothetical protein